MADEVAIVEGQDHRFTTHEAGEHGADWGEMTCSEHGVTGKFPFPKDPSIKFILVELPAPCGDHKFQFVNPHYVEPEDEAAEDDGNTQVTSEDAGIGSSGQ